MVLKNEILGKIRANRELRNRLMLDLPISHGTLYSVLKNNKENSVLTRQRALELISLYEDVTLDAIIENIL